MGCVRAFVSLPAYISVLTLHQHIYTHKYTFMHTNARVHVHVRTHTRPTHTHTHTNTHKYTHFSFFQALSCLTLKRRFYPFLKPSCKYVPFPFATTPARWCVLNCCWPLFLHRVLVRDVAGNELLLAAPLFCVSLCCCMLVVLATHNLVSSI